MWGENGYVTVEECAERMGITAERVVEYVRRGILRADRDGYVQPAIVSGAVDEGLSP